MAIQILGLRDYVDKKGIKRKTTRFFNKKWMLGKIEDVFREDSVKALLKSVDKEEQYNLYFTVASCTKERVLDTQKVLPFDVDWVTLTNGSLEERTEKATKTRDILAGLLKVQPEGIGLIWSGHGVQLFVFLEEAFASTQTFTQYRSSYVKLCKKFEALLRQHGIEHREVDTTAFSSARLMRLPFTINRKENNPDTEAFLVGPCEPVYIAMPLEEETLPKEHTITDAALKQFSKPDTEAVLQECEFIKWSKVNQNTVTEPQWYALLSILARLSSGRELCHTYSKEYKNYDEHSTDTKIDQALEAAGPRTCEGVENLWPGCKQCPHYQSKEIKSPIQIKGATYIATESTGFRNIRLDKNGVPREADVNYNDLVKAFSRDFNYCTYIEPGGAESTSIYVYRNDIWEREKIPTIRAWAEEKLRHNALKREIDEFTSKLLRHNIQKENFLLNGGKYIQFRNCVLELSTGKTMAPSPEFGITYKVPHIYQEDAKCPKWDAFLEDICEGDGHKIRLLNEFGAYTLFSSQSWLTKALVLVGDGANGKTVYIKALTNVVGVENTMSIRMKMLESQDAPVLLENKLLNACGEVSKNSLKDSSCLKELVEGGWTTGRLQYERSRSVFLFAKFIFACNEAPTINDKSHGLYRRLLVINLNKRYEYGVNANPYLSQELAEETPGIIAKFRNCYKELAARGCFIESEQMLKEKQDLYDEGNVISFFVSTYLERGNDEDFIKASTLVTMFNRFKDENHPNFKDFSTQALSADIQRTFKTGKSFTKCVNKKIIRGYSGIKIKPETELSYIQDEEEEY